nr:MAG TPA: hypothetical protein [Crassvirales sp.]DAT79588.1 MAG TPA: hypothetical protein [Caudoviricetes sp.]
MGIPLNLSPFTCLFSFVHAVLYCTKNLSRQAKLIMALK